MATPTATSSTSDGPVLNVITKRLRALRKKLNRIHQMEDSLSQGKSLNSEQLEVVRSKPVLLALIDELDKLRSPLSSALDEELSLPLQTHDTSKTDDSCIINNNTNNNNVVEDLVKLMYFGSLFDVKPQSEFTSLMLTRTHERGCCLTYDYVTDDASDDLLGEPDLDLISALQGLMVSRPANSTLSHRNALQLCVEHAHLWLHRAHQPIDSGLNVTYAALREKLNKIMSSDYFTATPQMKGPGEVAAAAAVGNFSMFQAPAHESVVNTEVPVQVEASPEQYQESEENTANGEEYESTGYQPGNIQESQKDEWEPEPENPPEVVSVQADQEQSQTAEGDQGYTNVDFKDQQYVHRRGFRGGRGGGRRGYSNGRGGRGTVRGDGPYQNGRDQYSDNYYPRNNYYNRRGGRGRTGGGGGGGGGGGAGGYNNSSGAQGNHSQANIGVAS